ncbi:mgmt family protein [Ophiostoma piceae UAMH 11346]|uniref:Mgmt family protein n=1 Tax=Ophiostoma piceae (strain UAMH 11346) TaxID=1262450 RepID=S3C8J7_OPHP1|nr:mgmt family protein [Ophiostoma piceae UAMH 11346]
MPRTDEAESFFFAVYAAVQQVPVGKVTSYGHIAKLIGTPQRPRQVGVCLKHLPDENSVQDGRLSRFHSGTVPWQRVLSAKGVISPRGAEAGGALGRNRQAVALRDEGVEVTQDAMGELKVDLTQYGWFPRQLPSETTIDGDDDDDDVEVKEEDSD